MAEYLQIRNWHEFQHYKERNPPWIKLHVNIFASEDWVTLADASKLVMVACMIIGSKNGGKVPNNPDYIKRVAYLDKRPDLTPLIECGFFEKPLASASTKQADASAVQADASECLTRERGDTDTEEKDISIKFDSWWSVYPRRVGKGQARKAFATALGKTDLQTLIDGAKRYAASREGEDAKFTAHPATWLNGERWADDLAAVSEKTPEQVEREKAELAAHKAMVDRNLQKDQQAAEKRLLEFARIAQERREAKNTSAGTQDDVLRTTGQI